MNEALLLHSSMHLSLFHRVMINMLKKKKTVFLNHCSSLSILKITSQCLFAVANLSCLKNSKDMYDTVISDQYQT